MESTEINMAEDLKRFLFICEIHWPDLAASRKCGESEGSINLT
jgi:hypothetical protein